MSRFKIFLLSFSESAKLSYLCKSVRLHKIVFIIYWDKNLKRQWNTYGRITNVTMVIRLYNYRTTTQILLVCNNLAISILIHMKVPTNFVGADKKPIICRVILTQNKSFSLSCAYGDILTILYSAVWADWKSTLTLSIPM